MGTTMNATVDARSLIAQHGEDAVAILLSEIQTLLRDGDEARALEVDQILQVVEEHFSERTSR